MAGYMYLGSQKVCPAVLLGDGYRELPTYQVVDGVASKRTCELKGDEFSNITSIDDYCFQYIFQECTGITGNVDFHSLETVGEGGLYCSFRNCTGIGITRTCFSSLKTVENRGLYCSFSGCSGLKELCFDSLETIKDYGLTYSFEYCTELETARFPALKNLKYGCISYMFQGCIKIKDVYFNSLTTTSFQDGTGADFRGFFRDTGTNVVHTIHFPSNLESTIQGLIGYPLFSGASGYVTLAFDLPATS